ncbi:MAG: toll/interleukin-1 receptor domain-containing protein [Burkholderiaceae bacterium]
MFTDKTSGKKSACKHHANRGRSHCIFHLPGAEKSLDDFIAAFRVHLQASESLKPSETFDCKGFIFPRIDLTRTRFFGMADFRDATFSGDIELRGSTFHAQADFHTAVFERRASFFGVYFESNVRYLGTRFLGRTIFSGSKFLAATTFHGCKFLDFAAFRAAKFDRTLVFHANEFCKDADFRSAIFYDGVDFTGTLFGNRLDFHGTRFHGELCLSSSHIKFLKKLDSYRANMRGAVLHTAQIWENDTLANYDFRDAFLLSVNLSGKRILDSDFTGAVFKSVLTVGWRPDRRTLENTKYIYTDYTTSEHTDATGKKLRTYSPVASSRVPAGGDFGTDEHTGFTLYTYLHEPARLNIALSVPAVLRTAVTNYLQLFGDFLRVTQGIPVELRTRLEGSKLRVEFLAQTEDDLRVVRTAFTEYQQNAGLNFYELRLRINFSVHTSQIERELFLMKMEAQLNLLKTELAYTKALLSKSEEHQALLKQVTEATRSPKTLLTPIGFASVSKVESEDDPAAATLTVVFCYSHLDEKLRDELDRHLSVLRRLQIIRTWHDRKLIAGHRWDPEIRAMLTSADVILLLLSSDFFNSDYCFDEELALALKRHHRKEAVVIPIVARPCQWRETDLAPIHGLPKDMRPVSLWEDKDMAWNDVAEGIMRVAKEIHRKKTGD